MEICVTCGHPHNKRVCRALVPLMGECGCEVGIFKERDDLVMVKVEVLLKRENAVALLEAMGDALGHFEEPAYRLSSVVQPARPEDFKVLDVQAWMEAEKLRV